MYYVIFTLILIGMVFWSGKECMKHQHIESWFMAPLITFVFFLYNLIIYLQMEYGLTFDGNGRKFCYIIQNTLYPLCYVYVCQLAHLKRLTPTTLSLFALILYNFVTNTTVFTDTVPVEHIEEGMGVFFYRNGKVWFTMETYKLIELAQLVWIITRTIILVNSINSVKVKTSKDGKIFSSFISIALAAVLITNLIPGYWLIMPYKTEIILSAHLSVACGALYILGKGYHLKIFVDKNNETVYLETAPKYEKVRDNFERLIITPRLYLKTDVTNEKIIKIVGTNRTYMAEMMKEMYGDSLGSYLNKLRIEEAKILLQHPDNLKMETIAEKCGFGTASTFTKAFKKETGVTPHLWRPE